MYLRLVKPSFLLRSSGHDSEKVITDRQTMANNPPEWQRYKVGKPSAKPDWVNPDCQPLNYIYHVAHIPVALEILRTGCLTPRLVYDKSKLNQRRITVTWLSPNFWNAGSRYGNIQFVFDWKRLAGGDDKRFYWVEAINYSPDACRILVTKNDRSNESDLIEFDPTVGDGPWWWDTSTDAHWWNGDYCLEIMAEGKLPISKCERVEFVDHHPHGCCIDPNKCQYKGLGKERAAALFLAATISQEIDLSPIKLIPAGTRALTAFDMPCRGWSAIWREIRDLQFSGPITSQMPAALPILRAALGAYSRTNQSECKMLSALFVSSAEFRRAFENLFQTTFALPPADLDTEVF
ncbi:MAG: hypothetical protein L0Y58_03730 [Verrucomicrobia subdivision 3 bacterium]|nr:hypothetical protein [Limisphaerales bacterium]